MGQHVDRRRFERVFLGAVWCQVPGVRWRCAWQREGCGFLNGRPFKIQIGREGLHDGRGGCRDTECPWHAPRAPGRRTTPRGCRTAPDRGMGSLVSCWRRSAVVSCRLRTRRGGAARTCSLSCAHLLSSADSKNPFLLATEGRSGGGPRRRSSGGWSACVVRTVEAVEVAGSRFEDRAAPRARRADGWHAVRPCAPRQTASTGEALRTSESWPTRIQPERGGQAG